MKPAFSIALREMRGGVRNFRIFLLCLALGVAAIAAVGSVRKAVTEGLNSEASAILGGDAEMTFTYRFASDAERAWMESKADVTSEVVDFRSMAVIERDGQKERGLVQVKGVNQFYPLYGAVKLEPPIDLADALGGDIPGAIVEQIFADRYGMEIGDTFGLGENQFRLSAILLREPDTTGAGFSFGPRVIVNLSALEGSGLLAAGTLFNSQYRLKLPTEARLNPLKQEAEDLFLDDGMRWRDRRNGSPGMTRFVERTGGFLVLVGLAGLAVGGIGISAAIRSYLDKKVETIATLKTLGASGRTIFSIYFLQIGALSALGISIGLILGAAVPLLLGPLLSDVLPVPALFKVYASPLLEAAAYGFFTALIFTLWPLARVLDIRAGGLFRDATSPDTMRPKRVYILLTAVLTAALVGLAAYLSGAVLLTFWSAVGILAALGILAIAAYFARLMAARLSRSKVTQGRSALRLALGSVGGRTGETSSVVLSLGLGLTVLATVGQIDANMRNLIELDLPEIAPSYFVVDIQNNQLDDFLKEAKTNEGVTQIDTAAMLRGIITRINDVPAKEYSGEHWTLRGDRGVSYADLPPDDAELTEGTWWDSDYSGPPLVSFAEEEGRELGLKLGDRITLNILGRDIIAKIANFRVVDFGTMGINFIMIVNESALKGAPHSHIATLYADQQSEAQLLRDLSSTFPNITAVRTRDAIARVADTLKALASATSWGAGVTLLTGFIVLIGAAAAGEKRREFEAAVLKTLGASRAKILTSFAIRSAILGATAGIVAITAGALASWCVMVFVMDAEFSFEPVSAVLIVGAGALASLLAGLLFAIRPLAVSPSRILRAKE